MKFNIKEGWKFIVYPEAISIIPCFYKDLTCLDIELLIPS